MSTPNNFVKIPLINPPEIFIYIIQVYPLRQCFDPLYIKMVRLSQTLLKFYPDWYNMQKSHSSYFRKQAVLYLVRHHKGAAWSTYKNATNRFEYVLKSEMVYAEQMRKARIDYNRMRIAAACEELDFNYQNLISTLPKIDIQLHLSSLARLSIYEPKTFKSLVDICKEATKDHLPLANFNSKKL